MPTPAQIESVRACIIYPRVEQVVWELGQEMSRLAKSGMCDIPPGTSQEYVEAIYALIEEGYAEIVRGSFVRRVKVDVDAAAWNQQPNNQPAKKQDASTQLGFDFGD